MIDKLHKRAMVLVDEAEELERNALMKYKEAASLEQRVADMFSEETPRTRDIFRISAVSLWFRARKYKKAKEFALRYLDLSMLDGFKTQLQELLSEIESKL